LPSNSGRGSTAATSRGQLQPFLLPKKSISFTPVQTPVGLAARVMAEGLHEAMNYRVGQKTGPQTRDHNSVKS